MVAVAGGGVAFAGGIIAAPVVGAAASAAGLGVAGGTLSGAAASSAGLAALGGGSLAANGLGIAGGTALIAATSGAVGTAATSVASARVVEAGRNSERVGRAAQQTEVDDGDVSHEEVG